MDFLAKETRFVQRKSSLDASKFLDLLVFCDQHLDQLSLEDLANNFGEEFGVSISKQAIHERFNDKAVDFMTGLLQALLNEELRPSTSLKKQYSRFNRIMIKDSTRYGLPESYSKVFKGHGGHGSKAQISIQYEYDLLSNTAHKLELTSACRNDQQDSRQTWDSIEPGDLLLRDLGYVTQDYLRKVSQKAAYFLSRLNLRWGVSDPQGQPIDFTKILSKLNKYAIPSMEIDVEIASMPMRLIVSKVPPEVYQQRIRKAERSSHGRHKVSDKYRVKAWLDLFITNVPKEWIPTQQVTNVYRLRWQVELVFKVWKSQACIDKMKSMKLQRFQCQLIARLIWLLLHYQGLRLIQKWLFDQGLQIKCSYSKFFKTAFRLSVWLRYAIFFDEPITNWLIKLLHNADKKYPTEIRRGKQNVLETICNLSLA